VLITFVALEIMRRSARRQRMEVAGMETVDSGTHEIIEAAAAD
jgi:hypothetical protein